jgi:hypothetical protein
MHDYKCDLHGFFEAWEPVCPDGCTENVQMVFLQPVGTKSDTTKHNDKTLNQLALDFNMTNIKSAKEGDSQAGYYSRNNKPAPKGVPEPPREPRAGDAAILAGTTTPVASSSIGTTTGAATGVGSGALSATSPKVSIVASFLGEVGPMPR